LLLAVLLASCSSEAAEPQGSVGAGESPGSITIYSGRDEEFVKTLFDDFTAATGIETEVRYGDSAELAATILEEGDNSPADVFSQDAGSLGAVGDGAYSPRWARGHRPRGPLPVRRRDLGGHIRRGEVAVQRRARRRGRTAGLDLRPHR
jgi:hypothetical protein